MSDGTASAWIASGVALTTVFLTQFVAENYKRFRDGSTVAAGIAGELSGYAEALPHLRLSINTMSENIDIGRRDQIKFRAFEKPVDRFFNEVVGKLGLLGPDLAEKVIYIYNNINAFRAAFILIHTEHLSMDDKELLARLVLCRDALERAFKASAEALPQLKTRSTQKFVYNLFH